MNVVGGPLQKQKQITYKENLNKSEKNIRLRDNTNDLCIIIKYLV